MTQENKDLLIKDLCARVPYDLVVQIEDCGIWNLRGVDHDDSAELRDRVIVWHGKDYPSSKNSFPIINCKPYLFPISSITKEQRNEFPFELSLLNAFINGHISLFEDEELSVDDIIRMMDCLNRNHIDYRGLIPLGLAIDCTNLNIY